MVLNVCHRSFLSGFRSSFFEGSRTNPKNAVLLRRFNALCWYINDIIIVSAKVIQKQHSSEARMVKKKKSEAWAVERPKRD